jgi:hypothetical protein
MCILPQKEREKPEGVCPPSPIYASVLSTTFAIKIQKFEAKFLLPSKGSFFILFSKITDLS